MDRPESDSPLAPSIYLPPELWTAVFTQISPAQESKERGHVVARFDTRDVRTPGEEVLRNISLTCWTFHDLALPIRFRHVELHVGGETESKATEPFARLAASDRLRKFVKVVSLTVYVALPKSAEAILCGMHNLEEIQVEAPFQMTQPLYDHICSLPSLLRLQVAIPHMRLSNDITSITFEPDQMRIQSVVVTYRRWAIGYWRGGTGRPPPRPWAHLPPWLASLALSSSIRHLRLPLPGIPLPLTGFTSSPIAAPSSFLSTLEVSTPKTNPEREEFWHFIKQAPSITTLILDGAISDEDEDEDEDETNTELGLPLPSEFLPALRHFEGRLHFANSIVPGRPVSTIVLTALFRNESLDRLHPLTLSTATIRSLSVSDTTSLELSGTIARFFPDLEELYLSVSGYVNGKSIQEWLQQGFALDIGRLKRLRSLRIYMWNRTSTDQERAGLSRLPDDHPMEQVDFGSAGLWHRQFGLWTKSEGESCDEL